MSKGKQHVRIAIAAATMAMACAAGAAKSDVPGVQVVAPVFSQLVAWQMPAGFHGAYETTRGDSYVMEAVPSGQTVEDWTQIVTLSALKDAASVKGATPDDLAANIAARFKADCPDSYAGRTMDAPILKGYPTYAALISCGSLPAEGQLPAHSETVLVVAIKGTRDYYTVQWAERGAPQEGPIRQDMATWYTRLAAIQPIAVCDKVPGEQEPYPSCLARLNGAAKAPSPAAAPPADLSSQDHENGAASGYAYGMGNFVTEMLIACEPLLDQSADRSKSLLKSWLLRERNGTFYQASLNFMQATLADLGPERSAKMLDDAQRRVSDSNRAEIARELGGDAATNVATCHKFERDLAGGAFDITPSNRHYAALSALARRYAPED